MRIKLSSIICSHLNCYNVCTNKRFKILLLYTKYRPGKWTSLSLFYLDLSRISNELFYSMH